MPSFRSLALVATACLGVAVPAHAQSDDQGKSRDGVTIGAGVATAPSYEGSDSSRILPMVQARATISGISIQTRGPRIYVDAIPDSDGPGIKLIAGPVIGVNLNRVSGIKDAQVEALGKKRVALELGGYAGVTKTGVITSDYDSLTASVTWMHDVTGIHDSYLVTPILTYGTPLSRKVYVGVSADATYAGGGYADSYFGVDAAGAAASGLPVYDPGKGWKNWSLTGLANVSLTGNLRHGLSLVGVVSYSQLLGDFADSPIVSVAGDRNQWFGGLGLAYTF
ncbi:MAG: MipA/OmpV family protein [Pseudomonadota bacterium]